MNIRPTSLSSRHAGQHQRPVLYYVETPMGYAPVAITREADGRFSTRFAVAGEVSTGEVCGLVVDGVGKPDHIDDFHHVTELRGALPDVIKVTRKEFVVPHPLAEQSHDAECDAWARRINAELAGLGTVRSTVQGRNEKGERVLTVVLLYAAPDSRHLSISAFDAADRRIRVDFDRVKKSMRHISRQ